MKEPRPPSLPPPELSVHESTEISLRDAGDLIERAQQSCQEWLANKSYRTLRQLIRLYHPNLIDEINQDWDAKRCREFLLQNVKSHLLWASLVKFSADFKLTPPRSIDLPSPPQTDSMLGMDALVEHGYERVTQPRQSGRMHIGLTVVAAAATAVATTAAVLYLTKPRPQTLEVEGEEEAMQPNRRLPGPLHIPQSPYYPLKLGRHKQRHETELRARKVPPRPENTDARESISQIAEYSYGIKYPCQDGRWLTVMYPKQTIPESDEANAFARRAELEGKKLCGD